MSEAILTVPDLGLAGQPIVVSLWFVKRGTHVTEGEPLVELSAGAATIDLSAPADGIIAEKAASTGDILTVGQRLATIACEQD
jgi:pyruvate/2-oxoglutarate dehydrogenase complex dihydrolipoamide acyltransferase (E2) component